MDVFHTKGSQDYPDNIDCSFQVNDLDDDENLDLDDDTEEDSQNNSENESDDDFYTQSESRFGAKYGIGKAIVRSGPGEGYASFPWALDEHERDMGLRPVESWLLKRLIKHSWDFGDAVYISMRKTTRDSMISSATLNKAIKSLLNKGFLVVVNRGKGFDRRVRYDIAGVYYALYYSIVTDPDCKLRFRSGFDRSLSSRLPEEVLTLIEEDFPPNERVTVAMVNQFLNQKGYTLVWFAKKLINVPHPEILHKLHKQPSKLSIQFIQSIQKVHALDG